TRSDDTHENEANMTPEEMKNELRYLRAENAYLKAMQEHLLEKSKRAARTVLTGMCYSVGSATRQGSSSPTRFIGQSAMTSRT
ncbi:hypothetical protein HUC49_23000, partial [Escherichia coli]|nr:hypothetical protein [Escherichia coli]NUE52541.1 hypothetical protein [Escherichia coli]